MLVFNGADDTFITTEPVNALKQEMLAADADLEFIHYPGAKHSLTNPEVDEVGKRFNMSLVYNAAADKASWARMQGFLKQVFEK